MSAYRILCLSTAAVIALGQGSALAAPLGTAFTYQGELKQDGTAVDETCEFWFSLWGDDGQVGEAQFASVDVVDGLFTAELNGAGEFGPDAFNGEERWLQIQVCRGTGCDPAEFVTLDPPQPITAAPYALYALNAPVSGGGDGFWSANGANIYNTNAGRVGIGTVNPTANLEVSSATDGDAVLRLVADTDNNNEEDNPYLVFGQDGLTDLGFLGLAGTSGTVFDGQTITDSLANALVLYRRESQPLQLGSSGTIAMTIDDGKVGIGTSNPKSPLHVQGAGFTTLTVESITQDTDPVLQLAADASSITNDWTMRLDTSQDDNLQFRYDNSAKLTMTTAGNVGIGTTSPGYGKLQVESTDTSAAIYGKVNNAQGEAVHGWNTATTGSAKGLYGRSTSSSQGIGVYGEGRLIGVQGYAFDPDGYAGYFNGRVRVKVLEITGGSDLSERFEISTPDTKPEPGMVVCIDPENAGQLVVSAQPYDRTVAGVISGAGGVKPGMVMSQEASIADGKHPVALTGRVYVRSDASEAAIQPGDLLTTCDTPGHAMKVNDHAKAQGAIIGKAMTSLDEGQGLVLVLVTLQ